MGRLDGKKAFITGGAQGLGRCFAEMFAAEGASVAITDVQGDAVQNTAEEINQKHPGKAFAFTHDVTSKEEWETSLAGAADAMGGISVLVNNAGIGGALANIETETWEMYRKVMDIDLDAIFVGTQLAMPYLKDNQPGSIINISSIAGVRADGNFLSYNVAKAGVRMISKSIALHCARAGYQITCNSIHPVFTRTAIIEPMTLMTGSQEDGEAKLARQIPMKRIGEPSDIGYMAIYLASDESKFITGGEFMADGGMTAR
ncbi:MAG: SDR family oxidoreductase [Aquisalinus sp.]|nr:SDR family oxidoreductase [Aquisalinus sp.]